MFERYTESARRTLFFARGEAAEVGTSIEPEHILLGLLRACSSSTSRVFARARLALGTIRNAITSRPPLEQAAASVETEILFSALTKALLQRAAEESDRMLHRDIDTDHLLLAILRDDQSLAAGVLKSEGMDLHAARVLVLAVRSERSGFVAASTAPTPSAPQRDGDAKDGKAVPTSERLRARIRRTWYLMFYENSPEGLAKAGEHLAVHQARLNDFHARGLLIMAGPLMNPTDGAIGLFISREAAEAFIMDDPFIQHGVVAAWSIREWNQVLS